MEPFSLQLFHNPQLSMARALILLTLLLLLPSSLGELPSVPRPPGSSLEEPTSEELRLVPGTSDAHLKPGKLLPTYRTKRSWLGDCLLPSVPKAPVSRALPGSATECQLQSLLLPVTELGLGYNSDETIAFRYCAGSCHRPNTHYGLALARLSGEGRVMGQQPCCHPTQYDDVAFQDNNHHWHHVPKLSAAACSCSI